jgi:hypothetical protein
MVICAARQYLGKTSRNLEQGFRLAGKIDRIATTFQRSRAILAFMGTRPDDVEKAKRALRRRQPLLAAWLDALNRIDNPMRRRAAKFRHAQRSHRDLSLVRGPRLRDLSSELGGNRQMKERRWHAH